MCILTRVESGRYELLQLIAKGGMGEVFLARAEGAHGFEKSLAIKCILPRHAADPQFRERCIGSEGDGLPGAEKPAWGGEACLGRRSLPGEDRAAWGGQGCLGEGALRCG